jgi:hypothetical protein
MIKRTLLQDVFKIFELEKCVMICRSRLLYGKVDAGKKSSLFKFLFSHVGGRLFWKTYVIQTQTCSLKTLVILMPFFKVVHLLTKRSLNVVSHEKQMITTVCVYFCYINQLRWDNLKWYALAISVFDIFLF